MDKTRLLTYNIRGLADSSKCRSIFNYLHTKKYDIVYMQETHSSKKIEKIWSAEWGSKIWFAHGSTNSKGVAILFKKNTPLTVHNVITDENGRFLILYVTWQGLKVLMVNVYGPNDDNPDFYKTLFGDIRRFSPHYVILGGDLNLALNPEDRQGSIYNNDEATQVVKTNMHTISLVDTWRTLKQEPGFTWRKLLPKRIFSRIDYWLLSDSLQQFILDIKIVPASELIIR